MQRASARAFALFAGLVIAAFAAVHATPPAAGQSGPGWVTLVDGKTMGDWDRNGEPTGGSRTARWSPTR